ncbi:MAG TPA: chemotaxis protein CheW [Pirellulales bacterium]|jgi:two-component system chemotaxis sensor kinase CheA|nr:chemotaxis protein CheW [Pirellulales bacterium]
MEMNDIVKDFLVESYENLDQLDRDLLALEQDPAARDTMSSVFRTVHTIKGTCGFLGFGKLEHLAHAGENLLSKLRDGELDLNSERTSGLLALVDAVRLMLANIENGGAEGDDDFTQLVERLVQLQQAELMGPLVPAMSSVPPASSGKPIAVSNLGPMSASPAAAVLAAEGASSTEIAPTATAPTVEPALAPSVAASVPLATSVGAKGDAPLTESRGGVSDSTIRVDVGLVDKLMNLVGELVLARNQILQFASKQQDAVLTGTSQRLNLITTELQEGVMKTRMQPINTIWSKFPRVVRDLSTQCGKQIRLEMEGQDTELDRTIIEAIKDPLTHLVRNSVDHGVETPAARLAQGKAADGRLLLRAFHEGGKVNLEIVDDGAGIDPAKIKAKAVERGLISAEQAGRMGDHEAINMIFLPGFSTAAKVTNVSGRGVGMDVVKTNIEKIGGTVDVQSLPGQSTTIRIKIPLTLAIIPALIVSSGGERYAIPQVNLLELVGLDGAEAQRAIEWIHGAPVYRLRGKLLPLVYLHRELKLEDAAEGRAGRRLNVVVLQADDRQFGLIVDAIHNTEEIVVKPLSKLLKVLSVYSGATIMGNGLVALILDVMGIAQRAGVVGEHRERARIEKSERSEAVTDDRQSLLLCCVGADSRMAIQLSKVARLEEFARSAVERSGNRELVQYRGQIMPLLRLSDLLPDMSAAEPIGNSNLLHVVVYSANGRSIGLVVERILDIVQESLQVTGEADRPGVVCRAVIQNRVTEVLDIEHLIRDQISGFDRAAAHA